MPRTNLCRRQKPHEQLGRLLAGAAWDRKIGMEELGAAIGRNRNTASARIRDPGSLTVSELVKLGRKLEIPIDELRAAIRY